MLIPEEKIYLIIKELVKENYPEELLLFETAWDGFRGLLEKWKNKSPESWSVEDYRKQLVRYFPSPDKFEESAMFPLTVAMIAIGARLCGKIDHDKIREATKVCIKRYGVPTSLESQIVSLLVEASGLEPAEGKPVPTVCKEEDMLEIGISEGVPYVKINGREEKQFRTHKKQFTNLALLAAARITGEGWLNKDNDLDLGENDQALSEIRDWLSSWLLFDATPKEVVRASEEKDKRVQLSAFKPKNIVIDKSICQFKSKAKDRVEEIIKRAESRMDFWEKSLRKEGHPLLREDQINRLKKEAPIMGKQMSLVQRAANLLGLEFENQNWIETWEKVINILELLDESLEGKDAEEFAKVGRLIEHLN